MMQPIFDEHFASGSLPKGWYTDTPYPEYSLHQWNCKSGDGVIIPLPHDNWQRLRLKVDVIEAGPKARAFAGGDTRTALSVALGEYSARGTMQLVFEWTPQTLRARVNGSEALSCENLWQIARVGSFHIGFSDCIIARMAAWGDESTPLPRAIRPLNPDYPLEVTVDFNDDLMACAWTHETFDALFKELNSWGASRVSWIDIGRREDEFFHRAPLGIGEHGMKTFDNVGDLFSTAVQHAHAHDIELIGILKPLDMAIHHASVPLHHDKAMRGIHRIGGSTLWTTRMARENQHLLTARKPSNYGPAKNTAWTRLDLVKDDDAPSAISPDAIRLWVSHDNETYQQYSGPGAWSETIEAYPLYESTPSGPKPTGQTRRARVLRFDNAQITQPFFAVEAKGRARSFANRLCDLAHLFGENGEETHFTYGLSPRATLLNLQATDGGFEFNRNPGTPSALFTSGGDAILQHIALDRGAASFVAFAKGKDKSPLAVMSPSFPQTRALWMTWIAAMLDSGADAIDLRPGHHHSDFAWIEYGFEEPVREEMLRRTGYDIWEGDDFDYNQWRAIRGEGWTQFLREASAYVRGRGKKFIAHIDGHYDGAPGTGGAMNWVCDWRAWIEEGLLDGITGKALWPASSFAREVLALAHKQGIPVCYVPYCNNFFEDHSSANHIGGSPAGCQVPVERLIEWGKESGFDSFGFYECASALRADENGNVDFRSNAEPLRGVMQRHFKKSPSEAGRPVE